MGRIGSSFRPEFFQGQSKHSSSIAVVDFIVALYSELVRVRIFENMASYSQADLVEVITPLSLILRTYADIPLNELATLRCWSLLRIG
jgi:hypothetical protein